MGPRSPLDRRAAHDHGRPDCSDRQGVHPQASQARRLPAALHEGFPARRCRGHPQPTAEPKELPTLEIFWPRFVDGYARANRQKPNGVAAKETIGRVHLIPILGTTRLDAITTEDVQQLKRRLEHRSAKTVNNVLTVLNVLLNKAVEWNVIDRVPCSIRLLPIAKSAARFHDFDEYERLVAAAQATEPLA